MCRNTISKFKKHLSAVHKNAVLVVKEVEQPEKGSKGQILMSMTMTAIQRGSAHYQQY